MLRTFLFVCLTYVNCAAASKGPAPDIKLNDGHLMPSFGLGTWLGVTPEGGLAEVEDDSIEKAVEEAIDSGYRHIDTAALYNTEPQVGRAINRRMDAGVITRDDIFVTTKLWNDQHATEKVVPALMRSLHQLNMTSVDLYLIHFPVGTVGNFTPDSTDYLDTWRGMIQARQRGLATSIGVSNFNSDMIERLIRETGVVPAVLQVEIHLNLQQPALLDYCRRRGIAVVGYTPFGPLFPNKAGPGAPPPRVNDPALAQMARTYNRTVPQVVLRYLYELGVVPIPKSVTPTRIQQNIDIFNFHMNAVDKQLMRSYDANYRLTSIPFWRGHPYYPFA